jgi:hypothetical protein
MVKMAYITINNLKCIDCGKTEEEVELYNQYNKTEEQLRNGYRCDDCKKERKQSYRRR